MANLAPSWRPKRLQNRGQNLKKSMLKTNAFLASFFQGFGPRFGRVFGRFWDPKMHEKHKTAKLAKTSKLIIFPRENLYFQGFDVFKFQLKLGRLLGQKWFGCARVAEKVSREGGKYPEVFSEFKIVKNDIR